MTLKNKRVLVTGAGGFIGSHLAEKLVQECATVRALVHYNSMGTWGWLEESDYCKEMEIIAGDITDYDSIRSAVKGCEIVFHLAALIAIPYSYRAPASFVHTNVEGTLHVLSACREEGVERVLHTSTSEVYGSAQYVPIDEKHPLQGQSPYSASKIGADKIAESFHLSFELPVVTLRPFNAFGPRQSARAIIPSIITQCLSGNVIHLGNLPPTRDLNYVTNTVEGYLCAATAKDAVGQVINLGSGREISMGDLAEMIISSIGKSVSIVEDSQRIRPKGSEVERLLADNRRAKEILDWQPRVDLAEGLQITIKWIQNNLQAYKSDRYMT